MMCICLVTRLLIVTDFFYRPNSFGESLRLEIQVSLYCDGICMAWHDSYTSEQYYVGTIQLIELK